jgi:hypothetical protein
LLLDLGRALLGGASGPTPAYCHLARDQRQAETAGARSDDDEELHKGKEAGVSLCCKCEKRTGLASFPQPR